MLPDEIDKIFRLANNEGFEKGNIDSALAIFEELKNKLLDLGGGNPKSAYTVDLIYVYQNISNLHHARFDFNQGEKYLLLAEDLCNKSVCAEKDNISRTALEAKLNIEFNLGLTEMYLNKTDQALHRLKDAEKLYKQHVNNDNKQFFSYPYLQNLITQGLVYDKKQMRQEEKNCLSEASMLCQDLLNQTDDEFYFRFLIINYLDISTRLYHNCLHFDQLDQAGSIINEAGNIIGKLSIFTEEKDTISYINVSRLIRFYHDKAILFYKLEMPSNSLAIYNIIESLIDRVKPIDDNYINILKIYIVNYKIDKCRTLYKLKKMKQADKCIAHTLDIIASHSYYQPNILEALIAITGLYGKIFNIDVKAFFKPIEKFITKAYRATLFIDIRSVFSRMADIIMSWHELQQETLSNSTAPLLKEFWLEWIELAIEIDDGYLLTDIVAAIHARRQFSLLKLNRLIENPFMDCEALQIVEQRKQMLELGLQLLQRELGFDKNDPNHASEDSRYQKLFDQWLQNRKGLSDHHLRASFSQFRIAAEQLQSYLNDNEALLLGFSPEEFDAGKPPYLILIQKNRIDWFESPEIQFAARIMQSIEATANNDRQSNLRKNGFAFYPDPVLPLPQNPVDLLMQQISSCWQKLNPYLNGIQRLMIIAHGSSLHTLPWQHHCPVQNHHFYPGLHTFTQRKLLNRPNGALPPSPDTPIFILANDAEHDPLLHLPYIRAEIDVIQEIWGESRVRIISDPNEMTSSGHLVLMGHGDFDRTSGRARFTTANRTVDAYELLFMEHPLLSLFASACLLGRTVDISSEPFGLFALLSNRGDIGFSSGAIVPIDDLAAFLLATLYHYQWREIGSSHEAMRSALSALETGKWPYEAQQIGKNVLVKWLPFIFKTIARDEKQGNLDLKTRCQKMKYQWTEGRGSLKVHYEEIINEAAEESIRRIAVEQLIDAFFHRIMKSNVAWLHDRFVPFWQYG